MWHCPLCQHPLERQHKTWRCDNHHSFDQAKSGYLNLLPVQYKQSRQPGDDKTMINARRSFHEGNGYQPLMQALVEKIHQYVDIQPLSTIDLYDAGCGEGSYLNYIQQQMIDKGYTLNAWGSDIAKHAVDLAAKRFKSCQFAVASSTRLPVADNCLDVVLQVFAPGHASEYARVIRDSGLCVTVDPGPRHLWELKRAIYSTPRQHPDTPPEMPGFELHHQQTLTFTINFTSPDMRKALLHMTPYYWRLQPDIAAQLVADDFDITAEFAIRFWTPNT